MASAKSISQLLPLRTITRESGTKAKFAGRASLSIETSLSTRGSSSMAKRKDSGVLLMRTENTLKGTGTKGSS